MKKLVLFIAAVALSASVSAQTVTESKTMDNFYIGINGGVATKVTGQNGWLGGLNPNAGLRIGRYFTPVFGLAVESNAYFANKPFGTNKTAFRALNTSLLATVNLSNLFFKYNGKPRFFEVSLLGGFGWGRVFGQPYYEPAGVDAWTVGERGEAYDLQGTVAYRGTEKTKDNITSKVALDFAFNFGNDKQFQFYIEPAIIYGLNDKVIKIGDGDELHEDLHVAMLGHSDIKYNLNNAFVQLNAGLVYKFKNSNGTHNFTLANLRDQAEVDALNAQINELRNNPPKPIVKEVVKEVLLPVKEVTITENVVFVTFAQGKSVLTKEAKAALDKVAEGTHVQVVGTASPEGSAALNQKLSEARAKVTAEYLQGRGVVVDECTGKGVQGTTSGRLAVVVVK